MVKRMDSSKELTQNSIVLHIIKLMYINYARTKLRAVGEGGLAQRRMQHDAAGEDGVAHHGAALEGGMAQRAIAA